jgi:DNA-binding NtrC family response regulator
MTSNDEDRIRMLLVDDEVEFLEAVAPPLVRRGFALTLAEDGDAALKLIPHSTYDVAVVDVRMPGISGVDLFYKLKTLDPDLPVIILTGHPTFPDAFQTSRDGAFEYLIKPCDVDRLARMARLAAKHGALQRAGSHAAPRPTVAGARILIAWPEEEYLDTLRSELETRGLDVTTSGSAADALSLMEGISFDVVLVDGALAGAEGAKLVRCITEARPEVEVIVMASQPSAQQALDILRSGAFAFLAKPESGSVLWRWITDAIASARHRRLEQAQQTVDRILDEQPD